MNVIMCICGGCIISDFGLFATIITIIICAYKLIKKILELNHELEMMERNHEYRKEANNDKQEK